MELPDKLSFTLPELEGAGGGSRSYLYEALRDRRLKAKKRGRCTIVLREDAIEYLKALPDYEVASSSEVEAA